MWKPESSRTRLIKSPKDLRFWSPTSRGLLRSSTPPPPICGKPIKASSVLHDWFFLLHNKRNWELSVFFFSHFSGKFLYLRIHCLVGFVLCQVLVKSISWDCRDGSPIKSPGCSSKGHEFSSQQPTWWPTTICIGSDVLFWCVNDRMSYKINKS